MGKKKKRKEPFVFVLMPFSEQFNDVYELGIKAACDAEGVICERVDSQSFDETILQRIYNQIQKADAIVADMSESSPNVFYEVGFAHALRKRVILLTWEAKDIPFDLQNYQHIVYKGSIPVLKEHLEKKLKWCFEEPAPDSESNSPRHIVRRLTRILANVSKSISAQSDMNSLLNNIINEMTEIFDAEVCAIFLNNPDEPDIIKCVAGSGFAEALVGQAEYKRGEGFTGTIFSKGETRIVGSQKEMKRTNPSIRWLGKYDKLQWAKYGGVSQFRNCIATPLKIGDTPIGVIKVENKHAGTFTKEDVDILEAITLGVLSIAIHNAILLRS